MYGQYGSIKRNAFVFKLLTNDYIYSLLEVFSGLKYFHSNHSLLQNYPSGRKKAVHIKDVGILAYA